MSQVAAHQYEMPRSERNLYLWFIGIGFAHLMVGLFLGFMQGMQHAGIDLYRTIPIVRHYYQGLTAHGVFNVLVFTTFFIAGFLLFVTGTSLRKPINLRLGWITFWVMTIGLAPGRLRASSRTRRRCCLRRTRRCRRTGRSTWAWP